MLIRRMFSYAALAIVALAGLGVIWVGNLLPLKAGLAASGTPKARLNDRQLAAANSVSNGRRQPG